MARCQGLLAAPVVEVVAALAATHTCNVEGGRQLARRLDRHHRRHLARMAPRRPWKLAENCAFRQPLERAAPRRRGRRQQVGQKCAAKELGMIVTCPGPSSDKSPPEELAGAGGNYHQRRPTLLESLGENLARRGEIWAGARILNELVGVRAMLVHRRRGSIMISGARARAQLEPTGSQRRSATR